LWLAARYINMIASYLLFLNFFIMNLVSVIFILTVFASGCANVKNDNSHDPFTNGTWIDLTYSFSDSTLYWPNNPTGFVLDTQAVGMTPGGYYYSSNAFTAPEHGGTHLDAPIHFAEGKLTTDQLPLESLTGRAVVIDVTKKALANRDYLISVADVEEWEKKHGTIAPSSIVLFRTGYGRYYPDARMYFGTGEKGDTAIPLLHFPGIDPALSEWLLTSRNIKAVGLDTPSIDYGQSTDFKTHRVLMGQNIPAFENVANLEQLPARGAYVVALPMKIKGGSGGPLRIVAWINKP
jgi:kynurenine formamidase